ncbi:MAG: TetR family transcriptional regulator [Acidimicrobiaceae bacterium]|nr:TetR family transcriptional regulator [Acidimicrobiaceae bacterium]
MSKCIQATERGPVDRTTTTRRATLDTERIVAAGIELADAEGVDRLTMRAYRGRLGFKVMALYNHVASKDELLSLMVDAVASSIDPPPTEHTTTMGAVRAHARHPCVRRASLGTGALAAVPAGP